MPRSIGFPGDVNAVGRPRVSAHEQPPRRVRLQALVEQFGEDPAIAGVAQRIERGEARHAVIGLVQPGGELDLPGPHHHRVGLAAPDDAGDVAAHAQAILQHAIPVVEEFDLADADRPRPRDLLLDAKLRGPLRRAAVHAGFPPRQEQVRDVHTARRPGRDGRRYPVLHVVRMRHHAQHAAESIVGERRYQVSGHARERSGCQRNVNVAASPAHRTRRPGRGSPASARPRQSRSVSTEM
jgi:hypothetical protein